MKNEPSTEFEKMAAENAGGGIWSEFLGFLMHNKKWWLLPMITILLVFGVLMILSTTAAAPFIYTLF